MCLYSTGHVGGGFMLLAGRAHYSDATQEVLRRKKEAQTDLPPGIDRPSFSDVDGLGQAAYLSKTPGAFQLDVLDHGIVFVVSMNRDATPAAVARSQKIARVVLAHLEPLIGS